MDYQDIFNYWKKYFDTVYIETSLEDKVSRYYFEYYNKLVEYGIDRARRFFWPINPMMSSEWLTYSNIHVPIEIIGYDLFTKIIEEIDPKISPSKIQIHGANNKLNYVWNIIYGNKLFFNIGKYIYSIILKNNKTNTIIRNDLIEKINIVFDESNIIKEYFDKEKLNKVLDKEIAPSNRYLWRIFTLIQYLRIIEKQYT